MEPQLRTPRWRVSETRGKPVEAFGRQITPVGRVLQVRWPGGWLARNRPAAVEIRQDAEVHRLPIHDVTNRAIAAMALAGVAIAAFLSLCRRGSGIQTQRRNRI